MSWTVTIPGQPISGNHSHRIGKGYRRGGIAYPKLVLTAEAETYQRGAALVVRAARPSGWQWDGEQLRLAYRAFLTRDVDCDNISKVVGDAIAVGLGIDDKWFLPCFESKVIDRANPRVEITIGA